MKFYLYTSDKEIYCIAATSIVEAIIIFCIEYELDLSCLSPKDDITDCLIDHISISKAFPEMTAVCTKKIITFISDYYGSKILKPSVVCSTLDIN
jgi:hypothetical protein